MKIPSQSHTNAQRGFSTLELLIAFAVLTLSISAVIMVAFGNQSVAVDTELAQRALYLAEKELEEAGATILNTSVANSFDAVLSETGDTAPFSTRLTVTDISECAKRIDSEVTWDRESREGLTASLSSIFVSPTVSAALGNDCATSEPVGFWDTPESLGSISPSDFDGRGTDVGVISISGTRYAVLTTDSHNKENFYVIDTSDPTNITSVDITGADIGGDGLNGLALAKVNNVPYAFVLDNTNTEQLLVINLTNPNIPSITGSLTLPNMTASCSPPSSPCLAGKSIFFHDEKIYIGTNTLTSGSFPLENNELHIVDVSNPSLPSWVTSINVNRTVYDISIKDGIAFLATSPGSNSTPLKIYDIDPLSGDYGDEIGQFTHSTPRNGTSVHVVGSKLYLGISRGTSGNDFFILDVSDPTSPTELGAASFGVNNSSVGGLRINGHLAFAGIVGGNSQNTIQIWNISNPASPFKINICTAGNPFPQNSTGLRFVDDLIFSSFSSNEPFRIFHDSPSVCST